MDDAGNEPDLSVIFDLNVMQCTRPDEGRCLCNGGPVVFRASCRRCSAEFKATHECFTDFIDTKLDRDKHRNKKHSVSRQQAYSFYMNSSGKNYCLRCPQCNAGLEIVEHPDNRFRADTAKAKRRKSKSDPRPAQRRPVSRGPTCPAAPARLHGCAAARAPQAPKEVAKPSSPPPRPGNPVAWPAIKVDARQEHKRIDAELKQKREELEVLDQKILKAQRTLYAQGQIFAWGSFSTCDWPSNFDGILGAA